MYGIVITDSNTFIININFKVAKSLDLSYHHKKEVIII